AMRASERGSRTLRVPELEPPALPAPGRRAEPAVAREVSLGRHHEQENRTEEGEADEEEEPAAPRADDRLARPLARSERAGESSGPELLLGPPVAHERAMKRAEELKRAQAGSASEVAGVELGRQEVLGDVLAYGV